MKKKILVTGPDEHTVSELANSLAKQLGYGIEENPLFLSLLLKGSESNMVYTTNDPDIMEEALKIDDLTIICVV